MIKIKKILPFFLAIFLPVLFAILMLKIDLKNLDKPIFSYSSDSIFNLFVIKSIVDNGMSLSNQMVGLPHLTEVFHINDFAIQSDLFNLSIVKFFTFFTSNPFLIANLFYLLTYSLVGIAAFIAFRGFKISNSVAVILAVLFSLIPYHQVRGVWHLFLSNYAVVGLSILLSLWVIENKIKFIGIDKKNRFCFATNDYFFYSLLITIFCSISGVYYAYYCCVILLFSILLNFIRSGKIFINSNLSAFFFIFLTLLILIFLYFPTYFYQITHGKNYNVGLRDVIQSEFYALRLIDMILPIKNHFIQYFSNLRNYFDIMVASEGEREASTLGIIASTGLFFSFLFLIAKSFSSNNQQDKSVLNISELNLAKNDQDNISILANINLLSLLFASAGGLVMIVSLLMPLIRSHARFSVFIAFSSLAIIGILLDKFFEEKIKNKKILQPILLTLILAVGIFDQTGSQNQRLEESRKNLATFESDKNFVEEIENKYPKSSIFILPVTFFPELDDYSAFTLYLHSKNLKWSNPAMVNRESSNWQKKVAEVEFSEFLSELKKFGFSGIVINRKLFFEKKSVDKFIKLRKFLAKKNNSDEIFSDDKNLIFFKI